MGSVVLGVIGALITLFGLIPLLGIFNFFSIPVLAIGLLLGIIGMCTKPKEKRGGSIAGTIICVLFLAVAGWRVYIGWAATKKLADPNTVEKLQKTSDSLNKISESLESISNTLKSADE